MPSAPAEVCLDVPAHTLVTRPALTCHSWLAWGFCKLSPHQCTYKASLVATGLGAKGHKWAGSKRTASTSSARPGCWAAQRPLLA